MHMHDEYLITLKNVLTFKTKKFKYFHGQYNRTWKDDKYYSGFWSKYYKRGQQVSYYLLPQMKRVKDCTIGNQKYQQHFLGLFAPYLFFLQG